MFGLKKPAVFFQHSKGVGAGLLKDCGVAQGIGYAQGDVTRLLGTRDLAGATQSEVFLGYDKTIRAFLHHFETLFAIIGKF
jgi:hypothetical protein